MRHRKHTFKVGRDAGHRRSLIANLLKSMIRNDRIETTVTKAKELRRHADRMVTLAKKSTLASRRDAIAKLMVRDKSLTPKEAKARKAARNANEEDRFAGQSEMVLIDKLFNVFAKRFANRNGGYTRIIKTQNRIGDNAPVCVIEYLPE